MSGDLGPGPLFLVMVERSMFSLGLILSQAYYQDQLASLFTNKILMLSIIFLAADYFV